MSSETKRAKVGEVRPSQMLFIYGVGSVVDLPNLSTMVMGLDDWAERYVREIGEERLLIAVQEELGTQVMRLVSPPFPPDDAGLFQNPFDNNALIGVPVAPFPRWMRCPYCDFLGPLSSGQFKLEINFYHPEQTRYIHTTCKKLGKSPTVLPARFIVACEHGHLDDFPWIAFVHRGNPCSAPSLRLREWGVSGSAADVEVSCDSCKTSRRMSDAFGKDGRVNMPSCRGRRPHLRDFDPETCKIEHVESILLGASNSWFPVTLSTLSIPTASNKLNRMIDEHWHVLDKAKSKDILAAFQQIGQLSAFAEFSLDDLWAAMEEKRASSAKSREENKTSDLKRPEWEVFSHPSAEKNTTDFHLIEVEPPPAYKAFFSRVLLVDRLREVRALTGFTRIESPGDFDDMGGLPPERRVPLSRTEPRWVPASEVRGEGIFIQFNEQAIVAWCEQKEVKKREEEFFVAHAQWRANREISPPEAGFPGIRFILIHSFAHALMRQLALECGYTAASIRERIYSGNPSDDEGPMAGVLLYTAAPDSEGTLGGLVSLGIPNVLERHIGNALEQMRLCASDPLCSEHHPPKEGAVIHAAACHACLFASETSCERGNKYLDRSVLVRTFSQSHCEFFDSNE